MNRQARIVTGGVALLVAALFFATQVVSQENAPQQQAGADARTDMMAKWKELNAKGPGHERFKDMVGTWDLVSKWWMVPGADPTVSKGVAKFRLIFDGRYLEQQYKCEMMGDMFEGLGIEGYDNLKKKYVSLWLDNQSTGLFIMEGTGDETGKVFTYHGKMDDPVTGQKDQPVKSIARVITDDEVVFEMYGTIPGVGEFKNMEITYTRRK